MPFAALIGDPTSMGTTITGPGEPTVLIEGKPAVVLGDVTTPMPATGVPGTCTLTSATVFFGGKPAVRVGDVDTNGATSTLGAPTVIIG